MKNEPKLLPLQVYAYHPKELESRILKWNDELALIERRRMELSSEADALREGLFNANANPEGVPAAILKLQGRRLALDIAEGRLIERKNEFKKPHLDARSAERARLLKRAAERKTEIEKALKKAKVETRYMNGVTNEDGEIKQLTAAAHALQSFENVVTEQDERRADMLVKRIAAAVPAF